MQSPLKGGMVHGLAAGGSVLVALLAVYAGGLTPGRAHAAALAATWPATTTPAVIRSVMVTTTTHLPTPTTTGASASATAPVGHHHQHGKAPKGPKSSQAKRDGHHGH